MDIVFPLDIPNTRNPTVVPEVMAECAAAGAEGATESADVPVLLIGEHSI
jgi:hypothetical protein